MPDLIQLKDTLNDINCIITIKAALMFTDYMEQNKVISEVQADRIRADLEEGRETSSDYDIQYGPESILFTPLIAEVKSSIPVKKGRFGAAQEANIFKAIDALLHGKCKSTTDVSIHYKFLVMLDCNGARKAVESIVRKCEGKSKVRIFRPGMELDLSTVYIVLLEVETQGA